MDTVPLDRKNPGFRARRRYWGCGRTLQGLSAGWADTYDSYLEGQSLDITGLPDDVYRLVSTTNPTSKLLEADYTNNSGDIYLRIARNRVTVVPSPQFGQGNCGTIGCVK
jgi:hypothetical protein